MNKIFVIICIFILLNILLYYFLTTKKLKLALGEDKDIIITFNPLLKFHLLLDDLVVYRNGEDIGVGYLVGYDTQTLGYEIFKIKEISQNGDIDLEANKGYNTCKKIIPKESILGVAYRFKEERV